MDRVPATSTPDHGRALRYPGERVHILDVNGYGHRRRDAPILSDASTTTLTGALLPVWPRDCEQQRALLEGFDLVSDSLI